MDGRTDGRTNGWMDGYLYLNTAFYQIVILEILKFGLHKIVYSLVKLLHWLKNYELFGRFVDADSENNFDQFTLKSIQRYFFLKSIWKIVPNFCTRKCKTVFEIVSYILREL